MRSLSTTIARFAALALATALIGAALASPAGAMPVNNVRGGPATLGAHRIVHRSPSTATRHAAQPSTTGTDTPWLAIGLGTLGVVALLAGITMFARRHDEHPGAARTA